MAGETALARQLKKLAVPQSSLLLHDKVRKSFLFDHREAAGIDRDVIFAYGTTGLDKLSNINSRFIEFQSSLFGLGQKDTERSVLNASTNAKLDEKITAFLRMLSPYFQFRAAHEALEWLVYRFHIHLYNVDALVACAMPYFDTPFFVRVVQLLNLDDPKNSRWLWLKQVQKSGLHLDYSAVINHFNADGGFRKFVCDLAPNILSVYKENNAVALPVLSFSMITIHTSLQQNENITDSLIALIFPYVLKALKSEMSKYVSLAYLVISTILIKVQLEIKLIAELLVKVFENVHADVMENAFQLLLLAFQQQEIKVMPQELFNIIWQLEDTVTYLNHLSESYDAIILISAIAKRSVKQLMNIHLQDSCDDSEGLISFTVDLIASVKLNEKNVINSFNAVMKSYERLLKVKRQSKQSLEKSAKKLLASLEMQYPEYFDKAVSNYFKNNKNGILLRLVNESVCSVKNKILLDHQTTLALGINHANHVIRKSSVKYLLENAASGDFAYSDFLELSLYERLHDDDLEVVQEVLSYPEILLQCVGKKKVLVAFGHIFRKSNAKNQDLSKVHLMCIKVLCDHFSSQDDLAYEIFYTVLPFIFPITNLVFGGFSCIYNSSLKNTLPIMKVLKVWNIEDMNENELTSNQMEKLNNLVFRSFQKYVNNLNIEEKSSFLSFMVQKSVENHDSSFNLLSFFIIILNSKLILASEIDLKVKLLSIKQLIPYTKYLHNMYNLVPEMFNENATDDVVIHRSVDSLQNNKFPRICLIYFMEKCIKNISLQFNTSNGYRWPSDQDQNHKLSFEILVLLFEFCLEQVNSPKLIYANYFKEILSLLINSQLSTLQQFFWFLSLIWSNNASAFKISSQTSSLNIALTICQDSTVSEWFFDSNELCINLLTAISSSNYKVRHKALNLTKMLLTNSKEFNSPMKTLFEAVVENYEEIRIDHLQCFNVLSSWLNSAYNILDTKIKNSKSETNTNLQVKFPVLDGMLKILTSDQSSISVKYQILLLLQYANSADILSAYTPIIEMYISMIEHEEILDETVLKSFELLLKYSSQTAPCLQENSIETKALIACLEFMKCGKEKRIQSMCLKILSRDFFAAIPSPVVQKQILEMILDIYMTSDLLLDSEVKKVVGKLSTYAYLILQDFQEKEMPTLACTTLRDLKKTKPSQIIPTENSNVFDTGKWKKLKILLEIIQSKSKLEKRECVISELFYILSKTLNYDSGSSVEYLRQLILSTIHYSCQLLGSEKLDERQFQVELIIQCIKSSSNLKTHQQSLLLLNLAATLFPDYVLRNVMSIFTFMGTSLVRQDDSYSFQVILQTIDTIVPSLLEASSQKEDKDTTQIVASVIRVFVNSLVDIPGHRQLPLFLKLLNTLDASNYLWIPIGQICDQYATVFCNTISNDFKTEKSCLVFDFAVNLHKQFSQSIQVDTCIHLLDFLLALPTFKDSVVYDKNLTEPFNIACHSNEQLQKYKYNILNYINVWISFQSPVSQIEELNSHEQSILNKKYQILLEKILCFLNCIQNLCTNEISSLIFNLIGQINSLLPCNQFLLVIKHLLKNFETGLQYKAIELLNYKLEEQDNIFKEDSHSSLLKLLKPLIKIVDCDSSCNQSENKTPEQKQAVLYSLHLLTKLIGANYPSKFCKVINIVITTLQIHSENKDLVVNSLLCLAQLCASLNVYVLPHLNTFMPMITNIIEDPDTLVLNDNLLLCIITTLKSIIENLSAFLGIYLRNILTGICILSSKHISVGKRSTLQKLSSLQSQLAVNTALNINIIEDTYLEISKQNQTAVIPLVQILNEKLCACSYEEVKSHSPQLQKFFLVLLNFRKAYSQNQDLISLVESDIILSVKTFVMKLSVPHFRMFFQKIYQWAVATDEEKEDLSRVFTFYKLSHELAKSLKSLFVVMAKYFLRHSASILDKLNSVKNENIIESNFPISKELVNNIIDTLDTCFLFDGSELLDSANFDVLLQPLVDQLENDLENEPVYKDRISNHLSGCLARFMAAVSDNALWKKLNYQILLKTRHELPTVRFAAIQVIRQVVKVMGDNYLILLPESIPFLAEVMEDESFEVEQECQSAIMEMEKILGEPIRKYF